MSEQPDDIHRTVDERLRRTRQRYTSGRRQLVSLLAESRRPRTIPELMDDGATQSQSSIYRNLAILEQCGVVRRLASLDEMARFELAEALTEHHHHLLCNVCGRIDDVTLSTAVERSLARASDRAAAAQGYQVDSHRLELVGSCPDCR